MILIDYLRFNPLDGEENSRKSNLDFFLRRSNLEKVENTREKVERGTIWLIFFFFLGSFVTLHTLNCFTNNQYPTKN